MQNSDFQVKRGMVFFLNQPATSQPIKCENTIKKTRPYLVLSNDKCNESSDFIHVAPISTRPEEESKKRYYTIPFKSVDGRECCVHASDVMLIPKHLCNSDTYSESISRFTRYNKNLMDNICNALARHFDFDTPAVHPEVVETMRQYPVNNAPIPTTIVPNITLNISVNGIPVSPECVSATSYSTEMHEKNQNEKAVDSTDSTTDIVKEVKEDASKNVAVEKDESKNETSVEKVESKFNLKAGDKFTGVQKKYIEEYIIKNSNKFDGTKSNAKICSELNVSSGTVRRYIKSLQKSGHKSKKKSVKRFTLPESKMIEFVEDYNNFGSKYCLDKYRKYGFSTIKQVCDKARLTIIKMAKAEKSKTK